MADCDVLPSRLWRVCHARDFVTCEKRPFGQIFDSEGKCQAGRRRESRARDGQAGTGILKKQKQLPRTRHAINRALHNAERAFLLPDGLPDSLVFTSHFPGITPGYAEWLFRGSMRRSTVGDRATRSARR